MYVDELCHYLLIMKLTFPFEGLTRGITRYPLGCLTRRRTSGILMRILEEVRYDDYV